MTPQDPIQVRVNAEAQPGQSDRPITSLPYEDYPLWRDVGMRELTEDEANDFLDGDGHEAGEDGVHEWVR
ncbi:hypothetical protein [Streptomyces sp. NPDC006879]|uniref:hypothetical protein n=1 Tax=Streptomyces sp. NPDC006879 TaxID=3364767 RepID=UPI00369A446C